MLDEVRGLPTTGHGRRRRGRCLAPGDNPTLGAEAVLRYLARYVFRVAITEGRIVGLDDDGGGSNLSTRPANGLLKKEGLICSI